MAGSAGQQAPGRAVKQLVSAIGARIGGQDDRIAALGQHLQRRRFATLHDDVAAWIKGDRDDLAVGRQISRGRGKARRSASPGFSSMSRTTRLTASKAAWGNLIA